MSEMEARINTILGVRGRGGEIDSCLFEFWKIFCLIVCQAIELLPSTGLSCLFCNFEIPG